MRVSVLLLLSLLLLMSVMSVTSLPRILGYSDRYPPAQELEKRKACLDRCADTALNALVVVVCQR
jgi:hypothetical protein